MQGPATWKQCPRCRQAAPAAAPQCQTCGHQFRTGVPQAPPAWTPPPAPPAPASRPPAGAVATLMGLVILLFLGIACWIVASHPRGGGSAAPVAATPDAPAGGSLFSTGPFKETVITTEQPEIRIVDRSTDDEPATVVFTGAAGSHQLEVHKPEASITIPPGEYQWELRGSAYQHRGTPDQTGTLTCRRYRRYDLQLFDAEPGSQFEHPQLGDH